MVTILLRPRLGGAFVGRGRAFIRLQTPLSTMTDDSQTGPWVLALGTLAIGVGAVVARIRRRRRSEPENRE